jgi:hypothetical protein
MNIRNVLIANFQRHIHTAEMAVNQVGWVCCFQYTREALFDKHNTQSYRAIQAVAFGFEKNKIIFHNFKFSALNAKSLIIHKLFTAIA